jgi:hypothetical protein
MHDSLYYLLSFASGALMLGWLLLFVALATSCTASIGLSVDTQKSGPAEGGTTEPQEPAGKRN